MTTEQTEPQAPAADTKALETALDKMLVEAREALDDLHHGATYDVDDCEAIDEFDGHREIARTAVDMIGVLMRLVRGRPMREIHAAFGAPGDWGYETALGKALARTYGTPGGE